MSSIWDMSVCSDRPMSWMRDTVNIMLKWDSFTPVYFNKYYFVLVYLYVIRVKYLINA